MPVRASLMWGLVCILGCGSSSGASGVLVEVNFDSGTPRSTRDEAVRVEVYLLESCDDVTLGARPASSAASTHVLRERGGPALGDDFDEGDYGLYAIAKDADCAVVAAGCEPVSIGPEGSGELSVGLGPFTGAGCPTEQQCVIETGECVMTGDCADVEDQTPCVIDDSAGLCRMGTCCTGCWNGEICRPGNATQECGTGGDLCEFIPGCKL